MSETLKDRARKLYRAPFRYEGGYVWDADGEMLADNHTDDVKQALRIRGWGRLTGRGSGAPGIDPKEAAQLQDAYGHLVAEALTAAWNRRSPTPESETTPTERSK